MENETFNCSMCPFYSNNRQKLFKHLIKRHRNAPNFIVHCSAVGCGASFKKIGTYYVHCHRKHSQIGNNSVDNEDDDTDNPDTEDFLNDETTTSHNNLERKLSEAQYLLKLKSQHNLTQVSISEIIDATKGLIADRLQIVKKKLVEHLPCEIVDTIPLNEIFHDNSFQGLDSEFLQEKCFVEDLGYVKPRSVKLGEMYVQKKVRQQFRIVLKEICGFYVPFFDQLQELLKMPEVQESLNIQARQSCGEFEFTDICDGVYFQKEYIQTHQNVLLFSIYHDDFEIVNPIGSHKKKHKISIFYWNLLNLPPECRFKLQATQLLAVASSKHVRKFGVEKLLENFIQSLQELFNGKSFNIMGQQVIYHGVLYYAMGDTPAAQFLGGFKEGVGLAIKPCRTCEVTREEIERSRTGDQFALRSEEEHRDRCDTLQDLTGETKSYWSKVYGITSKSCLLNLPFFDITKCILHDPMHILLEGVVKKELQLMLSDFIDRKKYFSLQYLNNVIKNFNYSEADLLDKPQELEKKSLCQQNNFAMTSIETKNFIFLLPLMVGEKVSNEDQIWKNFIRLVQITMLVISPVCSTESLDSLYQLIATHNHKFQELFPFENIPPKMHYSPTFQNNYDYSVQGEITGVSGLKQSTGYSKIKNGKISNAFPSQLHFITRDGCAYNKAVS